MARDGRSSSRLLSGAVMLVTIVAVTPKSAGVFPVRTKRFAAKFGFAGPLLDPLPPKAWWQLAQLACRIGCTLHANTVSESCGAAVRRVAPL